MATPPSKLLEALRRRQKERESKGSTPEKTEKPDTVGRGRGALMARLAARSAKAEAAPSGLDSQSLSSKLQGLKVEEETKPPEPVSLVPGVGVGSKTPTPPGSKSPGSKGSPAAASSRPPSRLDAPSVAKDEGPKTFKGSEGKEFSATANYIQLGVEKGRGVFVYEVIFRPTVDSRDERYRLLNQQKDTLGHVRVFDGWRLYLPTMLKDERLSLMSVDSKTGGDVEVTIIFQRQLEHDSPDMIFLYNNLFGRIMRTLELVRHNRNYFDPREAHSIRAYNLEVWPGYITTVDRFEGGLLLQADVAHRVLRTETVRDLLVKLHKLGSPTSSVKQEAEKQLLGTSVLTRYNNMSYIVDDIDFESNPLSTFVNQHGASVSYVDYYKNHYGIAIKDLGQPLLIHRPRKKAAQEKDVIKVICLVPELCLLTGLTDAMREDFKIMKEVGQYTRVSPGHRQQALMKFVSNVLNNPDAKAHLTDWGLRLRQKTIPLHARQLRPELLCFGAGHRETVNPKGDWGRVATSRACLTPVPLGKWAVVFPQKHSAVVRQFVMILQQQGPRMGIRVSDPMVSSLPNDRTETYLKTVRGLISPGVQMVVAIFPQMRADRYAAFKKLCCVEKPVASQVVNVRTISNESRVTSVVQKIALQINCKLGGELWGCLTPHQNLMVVGIDVYHDKTRKASSVAGVVVSINGSMSRYHSVVVRQQEGQEFVDALKVAFAGGMIKYWQANHAWPAHIVVFRDGVGDGQLDVVAKNEAQQFVSTFSHFNGNDGGNGGISRLLEELPNGYNPGFSFVVVQKRINTRIFSFSGGRGREEYENPPPGTVVDHTITRYRFKDFFLVPQSVNQGTVSPTHFVVVRELGEEMNGNTSTFGPDDIQKLAYRLTHMYFNWPGTVKVPAPVQYAHKLVDLVGQHLHTSPSEQLSDRLYYL